jgi:hypothetical protein
MNTARYAVTFGLRGCYMPDSNSGPVEFTTRAALASFIRSELQTFDLPAYLFNEVRIRKLWGFIQRHGSSTAHFALYHGDNALEFHGLTAEEFEQEEPNE